jgi:hypothetical protein
LILPGGAIRCGAGGAVVCSSRIVRLIRCAGAVVRSPLVWTSLVGATGRGRAVVRATWSTRATWSPLPAWARAGTSRASRLSRADKQAECQHCRRQRHASIHRGFSRVSGANHHRARGGMPEALSKNLRSSRASSL